MLELLEHKPEIIFTTAYDQYAIKAFEQNAVDYLLKPVDQDELITAVHKVKDRRGKRQDINMEVLMDNVLSNKPKKIAVSNLEGINYINVDEIICVQAEGSYSIIHQTDGRKIILSKNLKEYESLFVFYDFFRPHNSYIVNLQYVERFNGRDGAIIEMKNGLEIPISRRKKDQFLKIMNNFIAKQNSKPNELS
jgi:two-component system LytT family response regulator